MKSLFGSFLLGICCCLLLVHPAFAGNGLVRITDRVYAYVGSTAPSAADSFGANAGIIIGDREVVVVDTLVSAREADRFLKDIRAITDKPIRYAVDTHYHLDHAFGNAVFAGTGATVVAHEKCREEMKDKAGAVLTNANDYGLTAEDMAGTTIALPTITFSRKMSLELDGVEVQLLYIEPSHSQGSIMVYLPSEKTVFAGDVLFTDYYPYMGEADITGWVTTLDFLAGLDADAIIPGHGPVSGKKDIAEMKEYILAFDSLAGELAAGPGTPEEKIASLKAGLPARPLADWLVGASFQAKYLPHPEPSPQK